MSVDTERAITGAALTNPKVTTGVELTEQHFDNPHLGAIWAAVTALHQAGKRPLPASITNHATEHGCRLPDGLIVSLIGEIHIGDPESWAAEIRDDADGRAFDASQLRLRQMRQLGRPISDIRAEAGRILGPSAVDDQAASAVMQLEEFLAQPIPPDDWIIPGLLDRDDRVVITGTEGFGKSMLIRELAVFTAAGVNPFTRDYFTPKRVLVVDAENPQKIMMSRFGGVNEAVAMLNRPVGGRLWIDRRPQGMDLSLPADRMHLHHLCQLVNPDLLCIGPAYKLFLDRGSDKDEALARTVTGVLDELRAAYGFAVILEHHSPHEQGGQKRTVRPFGSSLWRRWPEFGFGLVPQDGTAVKERKADVVHWRGARDERPWPETLESGGYSKIPWVDPNPPAHSYGNREAS